MNEPPPNSLPATGPRRGGRKPGPLATKQRHVVSVRLTDAEYWRLTTDAARYKRTLGEVLRRVWLNQHAVTKLPLPPTAERAKQLAQLTNMAEDLSKLTKQSGHGEQVGQGLLVVLKKMHALLT